MEKVSVIVPVYQDEQSITRCITSLLRQTWNDVELIFIDDGSTDNSLKVLKKLSSSKDNIIIIHQKNMGVSGARNRGLEAANGKYVTFVDADDFIEDDYLKVLVETMQQQKTDLVIDPLFFKSVTDEKRSRRPHNYDMATLKEDFPYLFSKYCFHNVCGKLYKTHFAKRIVFHNNITVGEDLLYNLEYLKLINSITVVNENGYTYVENENSVTHSYRENDFNNQKILNEASRSFYSNYLNGNSNNLKMIDQAFVRNIIILILTVISDNEISISRKLTILDKVYYSSYFYDKLKTTEMHKKILEFVRKIFLDKYFYTLLLFGKMYKVGKQLLKR